MTEKKEYKELNEREIKTRLLQVDMHLDMIREKEVEIDKLEKEIKNDIPNKKVRLEIRKMNSDKDFYEEVISQLKKEIREKKAEIRKK